jgi:hypothetical protein
MYLYIIFRLDIFSAGYTVIMAAHLISTAVNYFQVIRARLKPVSRERKAELIRHL